MLEPIRTFTDTERFRLLVAAVTDYAICMLDPSGIITDWNAGAQRIKGYTADEIIGHHFSLFYTKKERLAGLPAHVLKSRPVTADAKPKAGVFARTEAGSGLPSSSTRSAPTKGSSLVLRKSPAT